MYPYPRSRRIMPVVVACAVLAAVLVSEPARADVTVHIGKAGPPDSSPSRIVIVGCPEDTVVLGGATELYDANNRVHITGWMPVAPEPGLKHPNTGITYAAEGEAGYASDWQAGTGVLCGPAPAGLEYVTAHSASGSPDTRSVSAFCPKSKRLLGTGGRITGGDGQVVLTAIVPAADLSGVTVDAHEDATGYDGGWSLSAYAICANELPDHQLVAVESPSDSSSSKEVEAPCPGGTELHGTGAAIVGQSGRVFLTGIRIVDDWVGSSVDAVEATPGTAGRWSIRAYAICASD